jgi:prolipoprotein diacylglyceryltransferase
VYDGLLMLAIFVVVLAYWRRTRGRPPESRIYWGYLLLLGAGRFAESLLRTDPFFVGNLQQAQLLGLVYLAAGGVMLPILHRRSTSKPLPKAVSDR